MKRTEEKYSDMKSALDESSSVNRRFLVSFLLFEVYMLVIVGSTSDMQLLIPDSQVRLPLANFDIPLFGFYIMAPIFMIAIHFNLLFNILQHNQKLFSWNEKVNSAEKKVLLQPFLFNFLIRFSPGQINYYLLRTILYGIIYFFPLGLLVLTQLKFSKYHSFPMTFWHFLSVLIDVLLLLIYWPRIINPEFLDDKNEELENLFKYRISPISHHLWKVATIAITFVLLVVWLISLDTVVFSVWKHIELLIQTDKTGIEDFIEFVLPSARIILAICYFLVVAFNWKRIWRENFCKTIWLISWKTILLVPLWKMLWRIFLFFFRFVTAPRNSLKNLREKYSFKSFFLSVCQRTDLSGVFLVLIIGISFVNFLMISSLLVGCFPTSESFRYVYPSLTITEKTLVAEGPSDTIIRYYLDEKKDSASDWLDFTQGLNLQGRDLRFAYFRLSKLFKANLRYAQLQGANLRYAQLQGADLRSAELQGVDLWYAELQGADLRSAELQGAILEYAQLQGADLRSAELQGADLRSAELQGADLVSAQLQGADLWYAQLQGADLWYARLQGANLESAQLQGANLESAQLQGANLESAQLQGANLGHAQLQGANLGHAQLQGIWGEADLDTAVNWDKLSERILPTIPESKRGEFIKVISNAKERSQKFDSEHVYEKLKTDITVEQFIESRNKFSCQSEYTAKGILQQYSDEVLVGLYRKKEPSTTKEKLKKELREYMNHNCPEIEKKMEW